MIILPYLSYLRLVLFFLHLLGISVPIAGNSYIFFLP